jgi:hypothetical protein
MPLVRCIYRLSIAKNEFALSASIVAEATQGQGSDSVQPYANQAVK